MKTTVEVRERFPSIHKNYRSNYLIIPYSKLIYVSNLAPSPTPPHPHPTPPPIYNSASFLDC